MKQFFVAVAGASLLVAGALFMGTVSALAQDETASIPDSASAAVDDRLKALEQKQAELEKAIRDRDARIAQLTSADSANASQQSQHFGRYTPGQGFRVVDTDDGILNIRFFTYVRYLNQKGLDSQYTNASGETSSIKLRQDILHSKLSLYFEGWILDPKFRYLMFSWTSNASQGLGAQIANTGWVSYAFDSRFTFGGGVFPLPGVRTTEGSFPNWLTVDNRLIADEFFRPSYAYGVFATGKLVDRLQYSTMLGNNLSQLGVDAGQLDNKLDTWSTALIWTPTTGEFGPSGEFGDFDNHQSVATRVGAHYTRGTENYQAQSSPDTFENTQLRISDGRSIFTPGLFGVSTRVTDAFMRMTSWDAGIKYRGYSLEGEYYARWINDFRGPGVGGLSTLHDNGFQLQASSMLVPKTVQFYAGGSKLFGEYGDPWETRTGVNWFPWKDRVARWNLEYIYLDRSPAGGLSLPYTVGATGSIVHLDLMLKF